MTLLHLAVWPLHHWAITKLTSSSMADWKAPAGAGRAITRRGTRNSSCFKSAVITANYPGNNLQTHLRFAYIMWCCSKKAKESVRLCSLVHSCHRTFRNSNDSLQCLNWPNCVLSDACNMILEHSCDCDWLLLSCYLQSVCSESSLTQELCFLCCLREVCHNPALPATRSCQLRGFD